MLRSLSSLRLRKTLCLGAAMLASAGGTHAHQIWFEQEGKVLTFRYGELDVNMHEQSPGGLDKFVQLSASWLSPSGETPLALSKQADGFALSGLRVLPGKSDSFIAIDKLYPMFDTKREGKSLRTYWIPATRWVAELRPHEPKLPLDILPTGVSAGGLHEFRVVFRGEALPGVKMALGTPSGWTLQASSDIDGKFRFPLPWRGNYVIGLYHLDEVTGERAGAQGAEPYQLEGYNTALSFHRATGLPPLPTAPRTLPASAAKK